MLLTLLQSQGAPPPTPIAPDGYTGGGLHPRHAMRPTPLRALDDTENDWALIVALLEL